MNTIIAVYCVTLHHQAKTRAPPRESRLSISHIAAYCVTLSHNTAIRSPHLAHADVGVSPNRAMSLACLDLLDVDVQKSRAAQNILEVNATSARDYKTQVLDNNKSKIEFIHAKQMANLDVSKTGQLHHIQKLLPKKYKEIFLEQQNSQQFGHTNLF